MTDVLSSVTVARLTASPCTDADSISARSERDRLPAAAYLVLLAFKIRVAARSTNSGMTVSERSRIEARATSVLTANRYWTRQVAIAVLRNQDGVDIESATSTWLETFFARYGLPVPHAQGASHESV
jgi:hypothetical protein